MKFIILKLRGTMVFKSLSKSIRICLLTGLGISSHTFAQCNWTTVFSDSYEYSTVIPYIIPGTTYQNTPQTYAGCVRTGSQGMYLNIVDNYTGQIYLQPFTNLCVGQSYRFSFSTRDAWTGNDNLTFNIRDASGTVILTQNVLNGPVWNDVTMAAFTAPTSTVSFEIVTNIPGGAGNDVGLDDLVLAICNPVPLTATLNACMGSGTYNLFSQIPGTMPQTGVWTGPSALTNGYQGTFTPGTNTNGLYTYTISNGTGCGDSTAQITVSLTNTPSLNPFANVQACTSYTLPAITGITLAGNEKYYTGPGGTGTSYNAGQTISTTQMLYVYGGMLGCSGEESFTVTISQPLSAGFDNGAYYCGPGPVIALNNFLSSGASASGIWSETTSPASGHFNAATGLFNTTGLTQGIYTFSYQTPAVGTCPADNATFTISIGNIPSVNLGQDTTLCTGQTITLNAATSGPYDSYLWNNNSAASTRFVTSAGTYSVKVGKLGNNQIVNGDFESGNTGFTTGYVVGTGGTYGLLSTEGTYAVTTNPSLAHQDFTNCQDHTPAPGTQMMVVNGSGTPGTSVWCQNVPVQVNTDYQFGAWVSNALTNSNVAQLQFSINGSPLGSIFSTPVIGCSWTQFFQTWNSGLNNSVQICILNQNVNNSGNDFLLDDITFKPICYSYDTVVVNYSAYPVVNLGADTTLCEGSELLLDPHNPGSTYLWNNGSTDQTLNVTAAGTYSVTVKNAAHCAKTDAIVISYENQKYAGTDSSAIWCETSGVVDLNTLFSAGVTSGGTWVDITNGLGTNLTSAGALTVSGALGLNSLEYVVHGTYCPNDTSHFQILVNSQPAGVNPTSLHLCNTAGSTVDLNPYTNGSVQTLIPYWMEISVFPGNQFDASSGVLDLSLLPNGSYEFAYILPADTMCVNDTVKVTVQVTENPVVAFSSDVVKGCFPLEVEFLNESTSNPNSVVEWNLGDGTLLNNPSIVNHTYTGIDCFNVTLTVTADNLCTTTKTVTDMICVDPLPVASFNVNPQQVFSFDPTAVFENTSVLNNQNFWDFDDGFNSQETSPTHRFPIGQVGDYNVQLIVVSDQGCRDTTYRVIIVKDQLLFYVPNAFTPDGDEHNNIFLPVMTAGFSPATYEFYIYNRWGELIFESKDTTAGWDGTYGGNMVQDGIYTWILRFRDDDSDKKYEFTGHVNLMR
ncbi:MAG: gliding motility-associated C-terminal domain-containing protein [Fluviicola sp.]|nr:gliding motility-associated C-terminal domain-containing protein [Fluviicola sp.]